MGPTSSVVSAEPRLRNDGPAQAIEGLNRESVVSALRNVMSTLQSVLGVTDDGLSYLGSSAPPPGP